MIKVETLGVGEPVQLQNRDIAVLLILKLVNSCFPMSLFSLISDQFYQPIKCWMLDNIAEAKDLLR